MSGIPIVNVQGRPVQYIPLFLLHMKLNHFRVLITSYSSAMVALGVCMVYNCPSEGVMYILPQAVPAEVQDTRGWNNTILPTQIWHSWLIS